MTQVLLHPFIPAKLRTPVEKSHVNKMPTSKCVSTSKSQKPLVIGPQSDPVFEFLFTELREKFHFLDLEGLGTEWTVSCDRENFLSIKVKGSLINYSGIYFRAAEMDSDYPFKVAYETLFRKLDYAKFPVIGCRKFCFNNISKPLQLKKLIPLCNTKIRIPKTYLFKKNIDPTSIHKVIGPSIVKSISSSRCQVSDHNEYLKYDASSISKVPTMFQEKLMASREIRIHVINDKVFPLEILSYGEVDYRYSSNASFSESIKVPENLLYFCKQVQRLEANPLVGIDVIEANDNFYVLEANPNPGWAAFMYSQETKRALGEEIFSYLKG